MYFVYEILYYINSSLYGSLYMHTYLDKYI